MLHCVSERAISDEGRWPPLYKKNMHPLAGALTDDHVDLIVLPHRLNDVCGLTHGAVGHLETRGLPGDGEPGMEGGGGQVDVISMGSGLTSRLEARPIASRIGASTSKPRLGRTTNAVVAWVVGPWSVLEKCFFGQGEIHAWGLTTSGPAFEALRYCAINDFRALVSASSDCEVSEQCGWTDKPPPPAVTSPWPCIVKFKRDRAVATGEDGSGCF